VTVAERRRLVITDDDVAGAPAPRVAQQTNAAHAAAPIANGPGPANAPLPSIQGARPAATQIALKPAGSASPLSGTVAQNVVASLAGALAGWAVCQLFVNDQSFAHPVQEAAKFFGVFAAVYSAIFASWESLTAQVWERALRSALIGGVVGAIGGAISGAIAQELYGKIIENIVNDSGYAIGPTDFKLNAARALGWAILGVGVGAALGAAQQSSRKLVNGLIGGAIGGAIGGFLFNYVAQATQSEGTTRFVTDAIAGAAIGIAIGLVEIARRQAWLRVTGGGMAGKEFILYHANTNLGSSPKAEITLIKDPAISPFHFRIEDRGRERVLTAYEGAAVAVNGSPVATQRLRAGDSIQVGNTTLGYQEKELAR
jgi:hypothetical protein